MDKNHTGNCPQTKILVLEQNQKGQSKIRGIYAYGKNRFSVRVVSLDMPLPDIIEDAGPYLPDTGDPDIVLDYLSHPDLSHDLADLCTGKGIPVVASGKKMNKPGVFTPPACCGLPKHDALGEYGEMFGAPVFKVDIRSNGRVHFIDVIRGAPCGASWKAAQDVTGLPAEEALQKIGLFTQYYCTADPSGWDPIHGKSPVHFAGDVHHAAFRRAMK